MSADVQVYEGDGNKPPRIPGSLAEAVSMLTEMVTAEDRDHIRRSKKDDLITLHFNFGMWIRNNFGLWSGNEAVMKEAAPFIPPPPKEFAVVLGPKYGEEPHPDDVSMVIITKFWESLQ